MIGLRRIDSFVAVGFLALFALVAFGLKPGDPFSLYWTDFSWTIASGGAGVRAFFAARSTQGRFRTGWLLITSACFSWFAGMIVWDWYELVARWMTPFPNWSDLGYLAFAPLMAIGMYHRRPNSFAFNSFKILQFSKLGILAISILLVHLLMFAQPLAEQSTSILHKWAAIAYPVFYVSALLFSISLSWSWQHPLEDAVTMLLTVALAIHAVTDSLYAYALLGHGYHVGNHIDILWLFGFAAIFLAASHPSVAREGKSADDIPRQPDDHLLANVDFLFPLVGLFLLGIVGYMVPGNFVLINQNTLFGLFFVLVGLIGLREWASHRFERDLTRQRLDEQTLIRSSIDALNDTYFLFDPATGKALRWNRKFCQVSGYGDDEIAALKVPDSYYGPEDLEKAACAAGEVMSQGEGKVELSLICKNGQTIPFEYSVSVVRFFDKSLMISIGRDMSERNQAESGLRASEQKFLRLFQEVSVALCFVNKDGKLVHINRWFTKLFGYSLRDTPDLDAWWLRACPDATYRKWVMESWELAVRRSVEENVDITPIEYEVTCKNGEVKTILIGGVTFGEEFLATFADMTDRIRTEKILRNERDFADSLIHTAQTVIVVLDVEGRIVRINPFLEELSGYSLAEVQGKDWFTTFLPKQDATEIRTLFKRAVADIQTRGNVNPIVTKDGRLRDIEWYDKTLKDQSGQVIGLLAIGYDMTERKQLEAEKQKALEHAQSANRTKNEFLAIMSHEIRTPMNAMIGMADVLSATSMDAEQSRYLDLLTRAGQTLVALIEDILDLSRIEAGQVFIEVQPYDLRQMVQEAIEIHALNAQKKNLHLETVIADDVDNICEGDPKRVRQVLLNLIGNAVKFTDSGKIRVEVSIPKPEVIHFSVSDTGIGIAETDREIVFKPFTQVDSSNTRSRGGSGLGLAICQRLVQAMGGALWMDSAKGQGSVFHFTVPIMQQKNEAPSSSPHPASEPVSGQVAVTKQRKVAFEVDPISILLVEDSIDNQVLIQAFLKEKRFILDVANNGSEGVHHFKRGRYDLVLMDIQMPVMDGHEATREIRKWETESGLPRTPIIALTAHAMKEAQEKSFAAGCDVHVTKPIRKKRLMALIEQTLFPGG
ncbi:MAG: PAS domain S-box protein [Magnetococcales bacterium]|nr:PAS domain S-box protein [Magnetococcales bacterium]MBF0322621.1 PAS domain S-box protein [Magnetococcales bacterium]